MSPPALPAVTGLRVDDRSPMADDGGDLPPKVLMLEKALLPKLVPVSSGSQEKQELQTIYNRKVARKSLWAQCLMNGAIMVMVTGCGMPIGFSAILLPQLQAVNSTLPTDENIASWIASVHSIATPVGAVLAGPMMDRWGRVTTLQFSLLPVILGWSLMCTAPNHLYLLLGRIFAGFAVGMGPAPCQVLIGEISEPRLRGVFASAPSASYSLGILLVYAGGSLPWRVVAALGTVLPLVALVALCFLPESPVWLVNRGKHEQAGKALLWLRGGDTATVERELHSLIGHSKAEKDKATCLKAEVTFCAPVPRWWSMMVRPEVLKPFVIIFVFSLLQIMSGSYIVIFYGVHLISAAAGSGDADINCLAIAVLTAVVRFIVSILTSICLIRLGRRKIGLISGIGTALACMALVGYIYFKENRSVDCLSSKTDTIIIATLMMTYVAMNTFGIFGLPCLMIGEVLPASVRGFVSGLLIMIINLAIFTTTKLYPWAEHVLRPLGVFLVFAFIAILATVYIYLFLPETKNRPLTQIEEYFATGKNYLWLKRDKAQMCRRRNSFSC